MKRDHDRSDRAGCAYDDPELARQLGALAHPNRLEIMRWLACLEHGRCKDVVSAMPLAQSTVSQHLKVLAEAGLVRLEGRRPSARYELDRPALARLATALTNFSRDCCDPRDDETNPDQSNV